MASSIMKTSSMEMMKNVLIEDDSASPLSPLSLPPKSPPSSPIPTTDYNNKKMININPSSPRNASHPTNSTSFFGACGPTKTKGFIVDHPTIWGPRFLPTLGD
ncbi:hypothetical protein ABFS82_12G053200 [Erythranthe guttata]